MIDTDKYEGHTEGPWWINHDTQSIWNGTLDEGDMNHVADVDVIHDNDLRLIADAPLLLEEVKRLKTRLFFAEKCLCGIEWDVYKEEIWFAMKVEITEKMRSSD